MIHHGDDLLGGTIDETVEVHLDKLPEHIVEIAFIMSINDGDSKGQGFDLVEKPTAFVLSMDNEELCDYAITVENSKEVHIAIVARLKRENDGWHFNATSTGFTGNLGDCIRSFGINV
jgi:tellurium resistance protein TerD